MERLMMKVQEWLDDYSEWLAERPLAATILIFVAGFACGTWAVYSAT